VVFLKASSAKRGRAGYAKTLARFRCGGLGFFSCRISAFSIYTRALLRMRIKDGKPDKSGAYKKEAAKGRKRPQMARANRTNRTL